MDVMMIIAVAGFALLCCAVSIRIAAGKQRSPLLWGLVELLFNLVGLLVIVMLPRHGARPASAHDSSGVASLRGAKAAAA